MALRRGFKAEAERIALELRDEIQIGPHGPIEPLRLAEHLSVPVCTLLDLAEKAPEAVQHLTGRGRATFSAATIYLSRTVRAIIINPAHSLARQLNSLCHELSHIVLDHEPGDPLQGVDGREWNPDHENEADWLAGCLLLPDEAALAAARMGRSVTEVAAIFGVSEALATWRMNATGAYVRAGRIRKRYGR
ncbi:MAG TPA: ImmA/IrrE family metallo-endopeptidase [Polyangia bacterium]|nr:ImmA/IrrE family metallo-endopeptidase [Polyangia bacterium]